MIGHFTGLYDLIRYPSWPEGIFEYQPDPITPLTFIRPDGHWITLDQPFQTDLASTPRCVWWVYGLAPQDLERPALAHDWLYTQHHAGHDIYGFKESNRVLQEACRAEGWSRLLSWTVRTACDVFGMPIWDRVETGGLLPHLHPHNVAAVSVSARRK